MKRTLALVVSLLLLAACLMGCGAKGKLVGTWQATADFSQVMQDILRETLPDSILDVREFSVTVELTFRKDGSCTFTLQEASVNAALDTLLEAVKQDFIDHLKNQLTALDREVSFDELLQHTGVDADALVEGLDRTFRETDFAGKLLEKLTFHGYFKISDEKLYIAETEEIDDEGFAFVYYNEEGVMTLPMVYGQSPMDATLTATICPLTFHKA